MCTGTAAGKIRVKLHGAKRLKNFWRLIMDNGIITTFDGVEVDVSEYIANMEANDSGPRESYLLEKYGSLHNAFLAFEKINNAEGRTVTINKFLDMLQFDLDWYEANK
jgi:hypothetical protein